ncbi:MAG TPA: hypothetical protein VGQ83_27305 [Polyangia bacterium]|jgi:hypothetical protein
MYYDIEEEPLGAAVRRELEALIASDGIARETEAARRCVARGRDEGERQGKAQAVAVVLLARGFRLGPAQRDRVLACTDSATLDRWLARAVTATSLEEALA